MRGAAAVIPCTSIRQLDGTNLVAIAEGETDEAIVVVAHHDTVRDSPGPMTTAPALPPCSSWPPGSTAASFRRTVILAAPDFEEIGLIGSRYLVRWLRSRYRVRAAVVYDPIGYMNATPGSQLVPAGIDRLYPGQVARLAGAAIGRGHRRRAVSAGLGPARAASGRAAWRPPSAPSASSSCAIRSTCRSSVPALMAVPVARHFTRSDHVQFWHAGLPAIQVTNTANFRNPNYHRPTDTPDTLDYATLAGSSAATALLVERLADA